jgi:molybdopterin synthase catalytic subunit/molybdopterin converting factor small subunit
MKVTIRLFAQQRQLTGWKQRELELSDGSSISGAWDALVREIPALAAGTASVRFARNAVYANPDEALADGDELAIIPPVAGGADMPTPRFELSDEPFGDDLLAELRAELPTPADGAVVIFVGQTRESPGTPAPGEEKMAERFAGEQVEGLEYEAFEEMALRIFEQIATEIEARYGVTRLAILHRTGSVSLGEASVVVGAAAPHRGAAFDAARYAIDELKARAPIWKSEQFAGGEVWVGAPARHGPAEAATQPEAVP